MSVTAKVRGKDGAGAPWWVCAAKAEASPTSEAGKAEGRDSQGIRQADVPGAWAGPAPVGRSLCSCWA